MVKSCNLLHYTLLVHFIKKEKTKNLLFNLQSNHSPIFMQKHPLFPALPSPSWQGSCTSGCLRLCGLSTFPLFTAQSTLTFSLPSLKMYFDSNSPISYPHFPEATSSTEVLDSIFLLVFIYRSSLAFKIGQKPTPSWN